MSTVTKRGDTYRIRVSTGYDLNGKQIVKSMTWKPTPGMTDKQINKELERQKVLFEEQCKNSGSISGNIKFEAFAKEWFQHIESTQKISVLSLKRLHDTEERTYAAIGHLPLNKINRRHIQTFIDNLNEPGINKQTGGGLSAKTQKLYITFISNVFNYAINCDINVQNPCKNITVGKTETKERVIFTIEQSQKFMELLQDAPLKYRTFFTVAIYTGFRRGELLGLEWDDIDFNNCIISVKRASLYDKNQGGMFTGSTKTKGSQRSLKVPRNVIDILSYHRTEQLKDKLKLGDQWHNTNRVFTAWNGKPMGADSARHWLEKFCMANDLPRVNIHSFRHLNASLLITSGIDVRTVSAALGHSQTTTTLNIYAHAFQEAQAKASNTIAEILPFKVNEA